MWRSHDRGARHEHALVRREQPAGERAVPAAGVAELRRMVLMSVASDHSKRNYAKALDEIFALCELRQQPLSRALPVEYRAMMLENNLSASTINVRLSAVRKVMGRRDATASSMPSKLAASSTAPRSSPTAIRATCRSTTEKVTGDPACGKTLQESIPRPLLPGGPDRLTRNETARESALRQMSWLSMCRKAGKLDLQLFASRLQSLAPRKT
jgi:Phage integrase, N-terminal SAM-like domain